VDPKSSIGSKVFTRRIIRGLFVATVGGTKVKLSAIGRDGIYLLSRSSNRESV
jgi:hypothetical protein